MPDRTEADGVAGHSQGEFQPSSDVVGSLCRNLPAYAQHPPIETVTFGWGVNEDGQLVSKRTSPVQVKHHQNVPVEI